MCGWLTVNEGCGQILTPQIPISILKSNSNTDSCASFKEGWAVGELLAGVA